MCANTDFLAVFFVCQVAELAAGAVGLLLLLGLLDALAGVALGEGGSLGLAPLVTDGATPQTRAQAAWSACLACSCTAYTVSMVSLLLSMYSGGVQLASGDDEGSG